MASSLQLTDGFRRPGEVEGCELALESSLHPSHLRGCTHLFRPHHCCTALHNRNHHLRDLRVQTLNSAPKARRDRCVYVCVCVWLQSRIQVHTDQRVCLPGTAKRPCLSKCTTSKKEEKSPFPCACAARHASKLPPRPPFQHLRCPAFAQPAGSDRHFPEPCRQLRPIATPFTPTCLPTYQYMPAAAPRVPRSGMSTTPPPPLRERSAQRAHRRRPPC